MRRKGLSQILWLIIAAAVMMMLALTLVFMSQGQIQNIFGQTSDTACSNAINQKVTTAQDDAVVAIPGTCFTQDSEGSTVALGGLDSSCEPGDTLTVNDASTGDYTENCN